MTNDQWPMRCLELNMWSEGQLQAKQKHIGKDIRQTDRQTDRGQVGENWNLNTQFTKVSRHSGA